MKSILLTAAILAIVSAAVDANAASGATAAQPVQSLYTCSSGGLSRVAFGPEPASCCNGAMSCPQLLSTSGLVKQKRANRT